MMFTGYDILDCIAIINFCNTPASFEMQHFPPFIKTIEGKGLLPISARRAFTQNRSFGAVTAVIVSFPVNDISGHHLNARVRYFPGEYLPQGSWYAAQDEVRFRQMAADESKVELLSTHYII